MNECEAFLKWYEKVFSSCQSVSQKCHMYSPGVEPGTRTYYFFAFLHYITPETLCSW